MDLLDLLIRIFTQNGYTAVFVALMICGTGLPLPEDVVLVSGGVIAGLGYANVHAMFALAMAGVLIGDSGMFFMGRLFGARLLQWRAVACLLTPKRYAMVQDKFERYGNRLLFSARFFPGMRTAVFVSAGLTHRVSIWRFLALDGSAALISVPVWVYLGYFGADNHEWLLTWLHRGQLGLWIAFAALLLAAALWLWHHRRRRARMAQEA